MRVLMLSKALVHGAYQRKAEAIARGDGVDLTVAAPHAWREPQVGLQRLDRRHTIGYRLVSLPIMLNGQHHLHWFPTFGRLVREVRPDVLHIDEESFNFATFLAMRAGIRSGARCCFFNWANIERTYPPPFSFFERYAFTYAAHAIAGNSDAAQIIRNHGYTGPLSIIPQFGVDPQLYAPIARSRDAAAPFVVGYLGRLIRAKGVLDLIDAVARTHARIHLRLIGSGSLHDEIRARASTLGLTQRLEILPWTANPAEALQQLDALVLPSRTTASWREQFGRVLIEAMSCGVPVIGSSSAEIPRVIGDAGIVFPEGDVPALAEAIVTLASDPMLHRRLATAGRERVVLQFTQEAIANACVAVYRAMLA